MFPQSPSVLPSSTKFSNRVLPGFPQAVPSLCPTPQQGYPQVIHPYVVPEWHFRPNILCFGLDKLQDASYPLRRYIEALGHKWRACSGASCIPKRTRSSTPSTSQQITHQTAPSPGMN